MENSFLDDLNVKIAFLMNNPSNCYSILARNMSSVIKIIALRGFNHIKIDNISTWCIGSNHDICDAGAVFHQMSYQANWELVFVWVDYKPKDDGYRSIYIMMLIHESHLFELRSETKV